jgi:hypothetical protein
MSPWSPSGRRRRVRSSPARPTLALGYNGLSRILGGSGNGGGGSSSFGGSTGIGRLFGTATGTEISWLLPAALMAFVAVLAATWTAPRTDRARAGILLWG